MDGQTTKGRPMHWCVVYPLWCGAGCVCMGRQKVQRQGVAGAEARWMSGLAWGPPRCPGIHQKGSARNGGLAGIAQKAGVQQTQAGRPS